MTMYQHEYDEREVARRSMRPISAPYPTEDKYLWHRFEAYLRERGLNHALAKANRWYPSTTAGDNLPRIVIPCTNSMGVGFWQARAMVVTEKRYQSPPVARGDSVVVVWPEPPCGAYVDPTAMVVVEGPMCALAAAGEGCVGVAMMGSTPPPMVLNFISTLASNLPILVVGDSDALTEAARVAGGLAIRGRKTKAVMLYGAKDLAELPKEQRERYLRT